MECAELCDISGECRKLELSFARQYELYLRLFS